MIARWIDLCARNRFLVFTGTLLLVLAGIWAERRMPLDALPDISDVQVIIHTPWNEPPNVIEDQVTYPIVTALLAAPMVKAVRAQTMFGDSYVFVVFEDGTDLYWARSLQGWRKSRASAALSGSTKSDWIPTSSAPLTSRSRR